MADITMCQDETCTLKKQCHRYTANACEYRQTYFAEDVKNDLDSCDHFWDNKEYPNERQKHFSELKD